MRLIPALVLLLPLALLAQEPNPTQVTPEPKTPNTDTTSNPIFKVEVVSRNIEAVSYRNHSGWTKIDFQGTSLAPQSKGTADINSRLGHMEVKVDIKDLPAARNFGPLFLTYVLWAITPDGHAANLGEVVVDSGGGFKADVTTDLQAFGLIVTAEPYFAVRQPSDVVVMENVIRKDTIGKYETLDAKYELLPRGQYEYHVPEKQLKPVDLNANKKSPLELYEAINAVQIAQYARSDQFASDTYAQAGQLLQQAQDYETRKQWNPAIMTSKEAVQKAEDARTISLRRQQDKALADERAAAAAHIADEKAKAEMAAKQQADAEAQAKLSQQQAQSEARQRAEADKERQEADAARALAAAEAAKAQQSAAEADRLRAAAVEDQQKLREQLLQLFNSILPTKETPRGLVVNMQDVLFDTGKFTLKETAREALAKISGIVISHPGLNLQVEGYTDSTGTPEFNQKLSEERAATVRDFLGTNGVAGTSMTAIGYGLNYPVAPNDTASGRKLNRRVELVVSGEVIGVKIGTPPAVTAPGAQPAMVPPGMEPTPPPSH
jgi:outer membrane protein OmpA-like peptidoglycan-associated protein